ncbi:hypothetical protein SS05631_c41270 [Sinorhizobium sp. CCBAU 05631]|nr:hypothetical protein SS05631_c41270 [Sinorhizobium sp. CCBAU 05631]
MRGGARFSAHTALDPFAVQRHDDLVPIAGLVHEVGLGRSRFRILRTSLIDLIFEANSAMKGSSRRR